MAETEPTDEVESVVSFDVFFVESQLAQYHETVLYAAGERIRGHLPQVLHMSSVRTWK